MEKVEVKINAKEAEDAAAAEGPRTPGQPFKFKTELRSILDNEHNGYTI
jgi:hypothetical protein